MLTTVIVPYFCKYNKDQNGIQIFQSVIIQPETFITQIFTAVFSTAIMDRNLGSLSVAEGGTHYSFGRKDPFSWKTIYSAKGSTVKYSGASMSSIYTLDYLMKNPLKYTTASGETYYNGGEYYSNIWYSPDWYIEKNGEKKSLFDPCPPHWELPNQDIWKAYDKNSIGPWEPGYHLYLAPISTETAWLPQSGGDGNISSGGALWSHTPKGKSQAYALLYYSGSFYISNDFNHAYYNNARFRYAVRCVQSNQ